MNESGLPVGPGHTPEVEDLVAAWAFGLESGDGARVAAAHVEECARCADLVRVALLTGSALAQQAEPVDGSPRLRKAVQRRPVSLTERLNQQRWALVVAAGFALLAVAVAGTVMTRNIAFLDAEGQVQREALAAVAAGAPVYRIPGTALNPQAGMLLVEDLTGERSYAFVHDVGRVPDGHQYTLWLARGEKAEAVANFRTGDDGTRVVALPGRLVDVKAAMVTVEPLSGANPAAQGPELIFGTLR